MLFLNSSPEFNFNALQNNVKLIKQGLSSIIKTEQVPDHVHSVFLNLANFIEHCDADKESLSSFGASLQAFGGADGIQALGDCAEKVSAYAKALHYREMEFLGCLITPHDETMNKTRIAENLINIYSKEMGVEGVWGKVINRNNKKLILWS